MMANPYSSFGRGQYGDADVMREMQRSGSYRPPVDTGGFPMNSVFPGGGGAMPQSMNMGANPWASQASIMPGMQPLGMMTGNPTMMNQMARGPGGVFPTGYTEDFSRMPPPMSRGMPQVWDPMPGMPGEVVVAERIDAPEFVGQRVVGQEWVYGVKPYVTMEKVVEVPQTIVKEHTRTVPKPEIVERIIEVPKMLYNERRTQKSIPRTHYEEHIEEVYRGVVTETTQHHVPKTEYQERLIEIPRLEHREIIEYEDRIEYREVPVDRIVEVPEIEYRIRDVERFVPQTFVQEYFVDHYTEVPIQQVQETERLEYVPVVNPVPNYKAVGIPVPTPVMSQPVAVPVPVPVPQPYGVPVAQPYPVPVATPVPYAEPVQVAQPVPVPMSMPMMPPMMNSGVIPFESQARYNSGAPWGTQMAPAGMPMPSMMNTAPMMPSMMNTAPMMPMGSVRNAYANYSPR